MFFQIQSDIYLVAIYILYVLKMYLKSKQDALENKRVLTLERINVFSLPYWQRKVVP